MLRQRIPKKRLLVLAGVRNQPAEGFDAIRRREPEGVMLSFYDLRNGDRWWPSVRAALDKWPHHRYLDSGAFTFIQRFRKKGLTMTSAEVSGFFDEYRTWLREHSEEFSWIIELDTDSIDVDGVPGRGVELTRKHRLILRDLVGDKLLPVWHIAAGVSGWKELIADYQYVAIGFDGNSKGRPEFEGLVALAHGAKRQVHALGVGGFETLSKVPYDTADSTNWQGPVRTGVWAGSGSYTPRKTHWTANDLIRAERLRMKVAALGYDPALLDTGTAAEKLEINIALIQRQQEDLNNGRRSRV